MSLGESALLSLIGGLYEAVAEPAAWDSALSELCEQTGSAGLVLHFRSTPLSGWGRQIVLKMDPEYEQSMRDHYCTVDPMYPGTVLAGPGVHSLFDLLEPSEFRASEFYQDWWRPQDLSEAFLVMTNESSPGQFSGLTAVRARGAGPYGGEHLRLAEELHPHLRTALALEARMTSAREQAASLDDVIDRFDTGVVLLGAGGRVLRVNGLGEAILAALDGISVRRQRVVATDRRANSALSRLIARAGRTASGDGVEPGGWITVPRPSGKRAFAVQVSPLRPLAADVVPATTAVVVLIRDPEVSPESLEQALSRSWGLTPAEARTVSLLIELGRAEDVADRLDVQRGTTRQHLKQAFAKTDTRGQAELVSLVLRTFAHLRWKAGPIEH